MPFFLISTAVYVIAILFNVQEIAFYIAGVDDSLKTWGLFPFVALASIISWNNIVRYIPAKLLRVVRFYYIGRNSMSYYCVHLIVIGLVFFCYRYFNVTLFGLPLIWSYIVSCIIVLPLIDILLRRYMPWVVGVKAQRCKGSQQREVVTDPLP